MNSKLNFNSGKTVRPTSLKSIPNNVIRSLTESRITTVEIVGKYETEPIFGQGQLELHQNADGPLTLIRIMISQSVIDFLLSSPSITKVELNMNKIDHSRSLLSLNLDIGLLLPTLQTSTETVKSCEQCINHVCQTVCEQCTNHTCFIACNDCSDPIFSGKCTSCNTPIDEKKCYKCTTHVCKTECESCTNHVCPAEDDPLERNERGDTLIAIISSYLSRREAERVLYSYSSEILSKWKSRLSESELATDDPTEAWKSIDEINSRNGTDLARAIRLCHQQDEQQEIINNKHKYCDLTDECPFIDLTNDETLENLKTVTFRDYLTSKICNYFIETYFTSEHSQLGINIIARMRFDPDIDLSLHPVNLIQQRLLKLDSKSPTVTRPNFKTKPARKDSILSAGSKRSSHTKRPSG